MTARVSAAVGRLAPLVRIGLITGLALAALAYPLVAVGGLGAKKAATALSSLPDELIIPPAAQASYLFASDNRTLITTFYEEYRQYVPIARIAPVVRQAMIAAEDARFYQHRGVDGKGIVRAFVANQRSGAVEQGASTLTMQYVRMALRDSARTPAEMAAATAQNTGRKLREARLAMQLEKRMSKDEVLERYLNSAYFGHRAYGIFAAAQVFFSKSPATLTLAEAATLAGLVKAPSAYDPASADRTAATERRDWVIDRMTSLGQITRLAALQAKRQPIKLRLFAPPNGCASVPRGRNDWGFYCDLVKAWWSRQEVFGANPAERLANLRRGGYRIVAALDPRMQRAAQRAVLERQAKSSPFAQGTVLIEPGTGKVRAMAVNRTYSLDQRHNGRNTDPAKRKAKIRSNYPNTVNPLLGGGDLPGYQAGSTFKLFTMLAALADGMTLSTAFNSPQKYRSHYPASPREPATCQGRWCPENASKSMTGRQNMWTGLGKSVNTYWVQLEERVGAERAVRMAERLGLRWRTDIDKLQASPERAGGWGAFTLGVADTTPLEMANAYATVAGDGRYCLPLPVEQIVDGKGVPVGGRVTAPACRQVVSIAVARAATDAARCVTGYGAARGGCGGWATASGVYARVGRPVAGKSGTTDSNRSAWFVGYTPTIVAAGFVADPDNPRHTVGTANHPRPREAVADTLREILKGTPERDFAPPPEYMLR